MIDDSSEMIRKILRTHDIFEFRYLLSYSEIKFDITLDSEYFSICQEDIREI